MEYKTPLHSFKRHIPTLTNNLHKGSNGRIGVIGGSFEYTGAPYLAAISALKSGADLVHVFCTAAAGPVIKTYSPELIVHPLLDATDAFDKITPWLARLHALVIGPGLGRDEGVHETVKKLIKSVPNMPIVLDADGTWILAESPEIFTGSSRPFIVTPNAVEVDRLQDVNTGVWLMKGKDDIILKKTNCEQYVVREEGSPRRCGGQGDVLAGSLGTFLAWYSMGKPENPDFGLPAVAASCLTRRASKLAFAKYKRSMVASNLIEFLSQAFEELFESTD